MLVLPEEYLYLINNEISKVVTFCDHLMFNLTSKRYGQAYLPWFNRKPDF